MHCILPTFSLSACHAASVCARGQQAPSQHLPFLQPKQTSMKGTPSFLAAACHARSSRWYLRLLASGASAGKFGRVGRGPIFARFSANAFASCNLLSLTRSASAPPPPPAASLSASRFARFSSFLRLRFSAFFSSLVLVSAPGVVGPAPPPDPPPAPPPALTFSAASAFSLASFSAFCLARFAAFFSALVLGTSVSCRWFCFPGASVPPGGPCVSSRGSIVITAIAFAYDI